MSGGPEWATSEFHSYEPQPLTDLNKAAIPTDTGINRPIGQDRNGEVAKAKVEAVFIGLETRLVQEIERADAVVGCMAWLTNKAVLAALAQKHFVSVLVQKEDFLRPDAGAWSREGLHKLYAALPVGDRAQIDAWYNHAGERPLAPVRCIGLNRRGPAVPRMHHKFMVFCDLVPHYGAESAEWPGNSEAWKAKPYAVWTGSFNATENGTRSLENAVIIRSPKIATAYLNEFRTLLGISEPLNWSSKWVRPEYRIGT